jgi:uncharacterized protein YuzE
MTKSKMKYFEREDILHLVMSDEDEANSVELSPNITVELNENGEVIGIEIVHAIAYVENLIQEVMQAKLLSLSCPEK